jgi:hypothetical protein
VNEPVTVPQPEPERYEWRAPADRDADVLGVLACALSGDHDGAVSILSTLDDAQTVSLCWFLARWHATELAQHFEDPVGELQRLALVLAHGRGKSA